MLALEPVQNITIIAIDPTGVQNNTYVLTRDENAKSWYTDAMEAPIAGAIQVQILINNHFAVEDSPFLLAVEPLDCSAMDNM